MNNVGVLVPVWNGGRTLGACLGSLARQTVTDFDAVFVDDGSTDATPDILSDWCARDGRFRVVSRPHEGIVEALNAGLSALETPLVARLDADDVALPGRLELQWRWLVEHPEVELVACRYAIRADTPAGPGSLAYRDWQNSLLTHDDIRRNIYIESPLAHPTVMFRRETVKGRGGTATQAGWRITTCGCAWRTPGPGSRNFRRHW